MENNTTALVPATVLGHSDLHAHVATTARDGFGTAHSTLLVTRWNLNGVAVLDHLNHFYGTGPDPRGEFDATEADLVTVTPYIDGWTYRERTEEGYRSAHVNLCTASHCTGPAIQV